jgi:endoglucanase
MKKTILGGLLFLMTLLFAGQCLAQGPVSRNGRLRVDGRQLVNERGESVQLRGVSLGWHCLWPKYYNGSVVDYMAKEWKADIVRAAIGLDLEEISFEKRPDLSYALLDSVVTAAIRDDIYVLIDFHSHANNLPLAKQFFTKVAQQYGSYPNVLFEIWNEPTEVEWAETKAYAEEMVPLIRQYAPQSIVILPSPHWDQDVNKAADDPVVGQTNVMYSLHYYAATHTDYLRGVAEYALSKGLPIFMSECASMTASGDGVIDTDSWDAWMQLADKYGLSWIVWSVSDKVETCSMLRPDTTPDATQWRDEDLKPWAVLARHYINRGRGCCQKGCCKK